MNRPPSTEAHGGRSTPAVGAGKRLAALLGGAFLLIVAGVVFRIAPILRKGPPPPSRFDMTFAAVPVDEIVHAGMPKDALKALVMPPLLTAAELDSINRLPRRKYVLPADRVIGVALPGAARAYPARLLNWHEIVNDTLAGVPIAVTYNPLSGGVVVFDRRVGEETLLFGVSGLLYNSNLLMFDRRKEGGRSESLWSQLAARAVTGPAAREGDTLVVLGAALCTWEAWHALFPESTVIDGPEKMKKLYTNMPYTTYFDSKRLRFPASPLPPEDTMPYKTPLLSVRTADGERVFTVESIAKRAGGDGTWDFDPNDGDGVTFVAGGSPPWAAAFSTETRLPLPSVYSFWFARFAFHPGTKVE